MKKGITLASATLTALALIATAGPAFADSTSTTSWDTTNTVTFQAPDSTTPLPPINVPQPGTPTTPGALALDYASNLNFGTYTVDGATTDFTTSEDADVTSSQPLVAWHDLRGAASPAFNITASTSGFSDMNQATITFGAGTASNVTPTTPALTDVSAVTPAGSVTLTNDGQPNQIAADSGATPGYYADTFANAKLSVPVAQQTTGTHTATITWNLTLAQ
ncbi:WxL domain-containing protein [Lactococcus nasutitermitis]|uniref:WxL domain-containing protein n=1 Tax=Lactococcus nasutitermitis TaxID=1652957 RepID=A0ABV9JB32_9LACT|nr:WxL domain-containing protein [Lactococcus nasutitermitis]